MALYVICKQPTLGFALVADGACGVLGRLKIIYKFHGLD
jgi:hypothetical protein